jgi:hypothetical protein
MAVHDLPPDDDDAPPFDPDEEPPADEDADDIDEGAHDEPGDHPDIVVISEPDPRIAAHARELGVTYDEAAELAEHIARGVADANEERLHDELRHAGAIPDNVRHLPRTEQIRHAVSTHRATRARDVGLADLDTFLNEPDPEYDWLIPDLLERGDRCVITGEEGQGKSTLLRQISIQVAAGIHPFTLEEIAPKRTLLIDVENPRRLVRRKLRPMRLSAGGRLLPGYMIPVVWSEGLDLRTDEDYERLSRLIDDVGADLVLTGPSYKLASGDPTAEETAKAVSGALDALRVQHDFAIILEAHQPYAATAGGKRALRPYGASLWSRWPEFGLHLSANGTLEHWRGDRDTRDWPAALQRGGAWPWTAIHDTRGVTFAKILDVTRTAGRRLSLRELVDACGGGSANTMRRAIQANQAQYDDVIAEMEG